MLFEESLRFFRFFYEIRVIAIVFDLGIYICWFLICLFFTHCAHHFIPPVHYKFTTYLRLTKKAK